MAGAVGIASAAFTSRILPVPINIEGEKIFTNLHLKLAEEELGFPLVGRPELEGENEGMVAFLEDLLTNQIERAVEHSWIPNDVSRANVHDLLSQYHEVFSGYLDTIRIDKVVALGEDRLLLWSFPFEDEKDHFPRAYRCLRFVRSTSENGELLFEGVRRDPIAVLINSLYQEAQVFDDQIPTGNSADFEYSYSYPPHRGDHAVEFLFNGFAAKLDVLDAPPPTSSLPAPLEFYRHSIGTFINGQPLEYSQLLGADSRTRLLNFSKAQPEQYAATVEMTQRVGKTVFFVLEADPVYYMFYLPSQAGIAGASFNYDMVWHSPEGAYFEVNVFRESFFDDILKQRGLFEEPFLRPTLIAANLLTDERAPLSVSVPPSELSASDVLLTQSAQVPRSAPTPIPTKGGLPWWIWLLVGCFVVLITYLFWRQRANTTHA